MAVKEKIRIRLKGYDHNLVDKAAEMIVEAAKRTNATVSSLNREPTKGSWTSSDLHPRPWRL